MQLDASSIRPLSLIWLPYTFKGFPGNDAKWFVVLAHERGQAICIKTTSKAWKFKGNPVYTDGWAFFAPNEIPCLPSETALQTDNLHEIPHAYIESCASARQLRIENSHPDCKSRIIAAIIKSQRMSRKEKDRMLAWLT